MLKIVKKYTYLKLLCDPEFEACLKVIKGASSSTVFCLLILMILSLKLPLRFVVYIKYTQVHIYFKILVTLNF